MAIQYDDPLAQPRRTVADNGFNRLLTKDTAGATTPDFRHAFTDSPGAIVTSSQEMGGAISFGHQLITVQPGHDIQVALDRVASAGGGVVRLLGERYRIRDKDLTVPSKVTLDGMGSQNTVLDFTGTSYALKVGDSSDTTYDAYIRNLSVIGTNGEAGVNISYSQRTHLENVVVTECVQNGFRFHDGAQFMVVRDCIADQSTLSGFLVDNDGGGTVVHIEMYNCMAQSGLASGFTFTSGSGSNAISNIKAFGLRSNLNDGDGYSFDGGFQIDSQFIACYGGNNGVKGYDVNAQNISFIAIHAEGNTDDGIENSDLENKFIGCKSEGNGTDWDLQTRTTVIGNSTDFGQSSDPSSFFSTASKDSVSDMIGNLGTDPIHNTRIHRMQNVYGSTVGSGKTIVWRDSTDQAGAQFEASFTRGDDRVAGVLLESCDDDEWGAVQSEGFTSILQVNGTDDIAVGDELSLYSANAVAGLARDGDMVFAIALEAYSTNDSSGVIDVILVPKYKKGKGVSTVTARAYRSGAQGSIVTSTPTKVQLNAESFDVGGNFDSTTNYRFVAPEDGYYQVNAGLVMDSNGDQKFVIVSIYKNGSSVASAKFQESGTNATGGFVSDIVQLDEDDYVELYVTHNKGSNGNIGGGSDAAFMAVHKLS